MGQNWERFSQVNLLKEKWIRTDKKFRFRYERLRNSKFYLRK